MVPDAEIRALAATIRARMTRAPDAPIAERFMEADAKFAEASLGPDADPRDRLRAVARLNKWL